MDYYSTLEIDKTATQDDIKRAYRKLAMKHHPDRTGGDDTQFKKIQEAYDTLSDPQRREQYDNPVPQFGFSMGAMDADSFFSQFFGNRPGNGQQRKPTYRTVVAIPLVDAYKGTEHVLQIASPQGKHVVNIKIPAGIETGDAIKYDNIIENATLVVQFQVMQDLRYERRGSDLFSQHNISVLELIVGGKFKFRTIDDRNLEVKVSPKTQPFAQLRIPGAGMPNKSGGYGDQIVLLKPFIPDTIDQTVIDAITKQLENTQKSKE
jgi:DnaJ-class molecular chaperone